MVLQPPTAAAQLLLPPALQPSTQQHPQEHPQQYPAAAAAPWQQQAVTAPATASQPGTALPPSQQQYIEAPYVQQYNQYQPHQSSQQQFVQPVHSGTLTPTGVPVAYVPGQTGQSTPSGEVMVVVDNPYAPQMQQSYQGLPQQQAVQAQGQPQGQQVPQQQQQQQQQPAGTFYIPPGNGVPPGGITIQTYTPVSVTAPIQISNPVGGRQWGLPSILGSRTPAAAASSTATGAVGSAAGDVGISGAGGSGLGAGSAQASWANMAQSAAGLASSGGFQASPGSGFASTVPVASSGGGIGSGAILDALTRPKVIVVPVVIPAGK